MFVQLFLGIYFFIRGISEYFVKRNFFNSSRAFEVVPREKLPAYLKRVGISHIYLGLLFITMGQIEYWLNPEPEIFIPAYILLGGIYVIFAPNINKKYTGSYVLGGPRAREAIIPIIVVCLLGIGVIAGYITDNDSESLFSQNISSEEKFSVEKDFTVKNNLLLELAPEDIKEFIGEPEQVSKEANYYTEMFDNQDRLVYEYSGFIIDFVGDIEEENFSFNYLKIIDNEINGPRGIKVGQAYEESIENFRIDGSKENNTLYEGEQVDNIWICGRVYEAEYVEQVVYIDIYEGQKANLVLNFNEQEKVEEIFLSKDWTWNSEEAENGK